MEYIPQAGAGVVLVALTLSLQCAGMGALIHWASAHFARTLKRIGPVGAAMLMVRFTSAIVVLHLLQILLWAGFYRGNCITSWASAFYFSTTNYSTVGSGDLFLPRTWRTLGALESIIGVLMCGFLRASWLRSWCDLLNERGCSQSNGVLQSAEGLAMVQNFTYDQGHAFRSDVHIL
jgi:voltage-gated potassium channel